MEGTPTSRTALPVPSRRLPSPEHTELLLSRSCPTDVMDNPYPSSEASTSNPTGSVGSLHIPGTPPPNPGERSRPTRPRVGNRVVSSSISPQRRGKSTSRQRPITMFASFSRLSPKREWSVFEQRMENEGQMRTGNTLGELVSESVVQSPLGQTTDIDTRCESPLPGAPSLQRVTVSDGASTIGYDSDSDSEDSSTPL